MNADPRPDPEGYPSCDLPLLWLCQAGLGLCWLSEVVLARRSGQGLLILMAIGLSLAALLRRRSPVPPAGSLSSFVTQLVAQRPRLAGLLRQVFSDEWETSVLCASQASGRQLPVCTAVGRRQVLVLSARWLTFAEAELEQGRQAGVEALLLHERSHLRHREALHLSLLLRGARLLAPGLLLLALCGLARGQRGSFVSMGMLLSAAVLSLWVWLRREAHADLAPTRSGHQLDALLTHLRDYHRALEGEPQEHRRLRTLRELLGHLQNGLAAGLLRLVQRLVYPRERQRWREDLLFPGYAMVLVAAFFSTSLSALLQLWLPGATAHFQEVGMQITNRVIFNGPAPLPPLPLVRSMIDGTALLAIMGEFIPNFVFASLWLPVLAAPGRTWRKEITCSLLYIIAILLLAKILRFATGLRVLGWSDIGRLLLLRVYFSPLEARLAAYVTTLWRQGRLIRLQAEYALVVLVELLWWFWLATAGGMLVDAYSSYVGLFMADLRDVASFSLGSQLAWACAWVVALQLLARWLRANRAAPLPGMEAPLLILALVPALLSPLAWQAPLLVVVACSLLLAVGRGLALRARGEVLCTATDRLQLRAALGMGALVLLGVVLSIAFVAALHEQATRWEAAVPADVLRSYLSGVMALSMMALIAYLLWLMAHLVVHVRAVPAPAGAR